MLLTKALNERLLAAGMHHVVACVSDPGLSSTGVNFQHDFLKSEFMPAALPKGLKARDTFQNLSEPAFASQRCLPARPRSIFGRTTL